jgi:hypothetical protein
MESVPFCSAAVVKVATPLLLSAPVPRVVDPDLKVTDPVGVPPAEVTAAVKVTDCLNADGLSDELSVVVVAADLMDSLNALEVLVA